MAKDNQAGDLVTMLREDNVKLLRILEEEHKRYGNTLKEERRRHDTIVMTLANQLQEIRLALPSPSAKG